MRALARALVSDESRADDLEQQTWLAALEHPPGDDRSPRGWIATVLRRTAARGRRTASRRDRRERAVARPEAVPATVDVVQEAEAHERVVRAVLELPEPFRRTVLLRYFDGCSVGEVASTTGTSPVTVRTRTHRALALLRERLDESQGGDRAAWVALLAPLAVPAAAATPTLSSTAATSALGALGMPTSVKVTLGSLVLLAGVGGTIAWFAASGRTESTAASGHRPTAAVGQAPSDAALAGALLQGGRPPAPAGG